MFESLKDEDITAWLRYNFKLLWSSTRIGFEYFYKLIFIIASFGLTRFPISSKHWTLFRFVYLILFNSKISNSNKLLLKNNSTFIEIENNPQSLKYLKTNHHLYYNRNIIELIISICEREDRLQKYEEDRNKKIYVWEWCINKRNIFYEYEKVVSKKIEKKYQQSIQERESKPIDFTISLKQPNHIAFSLEGYKIELTLPNSFYQTNIKTATKRSIRRIVKEKNLLSIYLLKAMEESHSVLTDIHKHDESYSLLNFTDLVIFNPSELIELLIERLKNILIFLT